MAENRREGCRPVLFIQPVACEGPGLIDEELPPKIERVVIRPHLGHPVPLDPGQYLAIVALGGPMGVYEVDKYPWIEDVVNFLERALEDEVPVLGICLGSQLLAAAAGARVAPHSYAEHGWSPIELTESGGCDPVTGRLPSTIHVFHWHGDRWELPNGAEHLASSRHCDHQIFRIGAFSYGFQCHLEITPEMADYWLEAYPTSDDRLPIMDPKELSKQTDTHFSLLRNHASSVFRQFWNGVIQNRTARDSPEYELRRFYPAFLLSVMDDKPSSQPNPRETSERDVSPEKRDVCPECGAPLLHRGGCLECSNPGCGWSVCG